MKKMFTSALCAVMTAVLLVSCSDEQTKDNASDTSDTESVTEAAVELDIEQTAQKLSALAIYDDTLTRLDDEYTKTTYVFGYDKAVAYAAEGISSDLAIVCEFADSASAETGKKNAENYIQKQISLYSDYMASEVPKLEDAYVKVIGRYLVVVVGNSTDGVADIVG